MGESSGPRVEFCVLGSLRILVAGRDVALASPKQRTLLAALLVEAGSVVSADRLIHVLWGQDQPDDPAGALQTHVSRLRARLGGEGGPRARQVLSTRPPGYVLTVGPDRCDARRFERLVEDARSAPAPHATVDLLEEALALWRGPPLAEFDDEFARAEAIRLVELRVVARELRADALLASGRHGEAIGDLEAAVAEHPFRERLRGQLMVALHRCGRSADALAAYRSLRDAMTDELGVEPSAQLRRLERAILQQDDRLVWPAPSGVAWPAGAARRQHQPADEREEALAEARAMVECGAWAEACALLIDADGAGGLAPADLERLARSSYLIGRIQTAEEAWGRAHREFLSRGEHLQAARCAFWLGFVLLTDRGEEARGGGWIGRAQRLITEQAPDDCAEQGYLLLPAALRELEGDDPVRSHETFVRAAAIGERFGDADLVALGRLGQGQALLRTGDPDRGLALLDEAMVAVETGAVGPIAAGTVYCAVIIACQQVLDLRRAQQWTTALTAWCADRPDLVPFRGQCLVHRAALAQLRGNWAEAIMQADRACELRPDGAAHYQRAELHRLRGEAVAAESAYARAADTGHDPQPGLALLRLDQGRPEAAGAAIRRLLTTHTEAYPDVVDEVDDPRSRAELLGAAVEVMLAAGDVEVARAASAELEELATRRDTHLATAVATRARGAVLLADGQDAAALSLLKSSRDTWEALSAPYEVARTRVLVARALRSLGDADTADVERSAAVRVFEQVGAEPALRRLRD